MPHIQYPILEKAGFSEEFLVEKPEKEPFYFHSTNINGQTGLLTLPCARTSLKTGKKAGVSGLSWARMDYPENMRILYGTAECVVHSFDEYWVSPFVSWRFQKYLELSLSRMHDRRRVSYWLGPELKYYHEESNKLHTSLHASYPVNKLNHTWLGFLLGYMRNSTDSKSMRKVSILFTQKILSSTFLSFNYTNQKQTDFDKLTHWQEIGVESFFSEWSSTVLEIRRSSTYKRFRELIINAGVKMKISEGAVPTVMGLHVYDLNKTYSDGILGFNVEFSFD